MMKMDGMHLLPTDRVGSALLSLSLFFFVVLFSLSHDGRLLLDDIYKRLWGWLLGTGEWTKSVNI